MSLSLRLDDLNTAEPAAFRSAVGPLFEAAPAFLARLEAGRPFPDWASLLLTARSIAHAMPDDEKVELVDAHPRLGAPPRSVSALSFREQGYDRAAPVAPSATATEAGAEASFSDDVAADLARLNDAYEARFGFRYCVFVAGRSREELLPGLRAALAADRRAELERALDAVVDIAQARLAVLAGGGR